MIILNVVTPAYKKLYNEYYLPTFHKYKDKDCKLIAHEYDGSGNGIFKDPGFIECDLMKLSIFHDICKINNNELIIYSDIDIIWLKPFLKEIESSIQNLDIIWSSDCNPLLSYDYPKVNKINMGITAFFARENLCEFFTEVKNNVLKYNVHNDFAFTNTINNFQLMWDLLDNRFSTCLLHTTLPIPKNLISYHATNLPNTIGLDNKYQQLNFIMNQFNNGDMIV